MFGQRACIWKEVKAQQQLRSKESQKYIKEPVNRRRILGSDKLKPNIVKLSTLRAEQRAFRVGVKYQNRSLRRVPNIKTVSLNENGPNDIA
jgi:hypothetical protein